MWETVHKINTRLCIAGCECHYDIQTPTLTYNARLAETRSEYDSLLCRNIIIQQIPNPFHSRQMSYDKSVLSFIHIPGLSW